MLLNMEPTRFTAMNPVALYPLRFEPIFKSVVWGSQALRPFLGAPSSTEPTGEAWVLSDQGEHQSVIANGPLAGTTLRQLMIERQSELIGDAATCNGRFPLLLKFLDARENLSVQVHPNDDQARSMDCDGGLGKTEAWVIAKAEPGSRVYAGLREGVNRAEFDEALRNGSLPNVLHSFEPQVGDCIFLEAGTVHAIGAGLMLFEVQQTSDITFRLYDWGRVDARTGKPRQLHIEQALACTNYERGPCNRVLSKRLGGTARELLVKCPYFTLERASSSRSFAVGASGKCRLIACVSGSGSLIHTRSEPLRAGTVYLIPAAVGACEIVPDAPLNILECGIG